MAQSIEGKKTYIELGGRKARVEEFVKNGSTLVYLEMAGQEDYVRAIASVIMQGRIKEGDHTIYVSTNVPFTVNHEGNRRLIAPLDENHAHCIVYHHSFLPANGMSVFMGENYEMCVEKFRQWCEIVPLPRLYSLQVEHGLEADLERELFELLLERGHATKLKSIKREFYSVSGKLLDDDYELLRGLMIEVASRYIEAEAIPKEIPEWLNGAPGRYETDGHKLRRVIAKYFSPSMTWYGVEYDPEDDIFFGYVRNEQDPHFSEWGYFSREELEELFIGEGKKGTVRAFVDRDLYFEDRYIDFAGKIHCRADVEKAGVSVEQFCKEIGFDRKENAA